MLSVKAVYKEGKFIPEDRSFPQGDNKHVIIIFPDEDSQEKQQKSPANFIKKWCGAISDNDFDLSDMSRERREKLERKHQ